MDVEYAGLVDVTTSLIATPVDSAYQLISPTNVLRTPPTTTAQSVWRISTQAGWRPTSLHVLTSFIPTASET